MRILFDKKRDRIEVLLDGSDKTVTAETISVINEKEKRFEIELDATGFVRCVIVHDLKGLLEALAG